MCKWNNQTNNLSYTIKAILTLPDGSIACAGKEGAICVWKQHDDKIDLVAHIDAHDGPINQLVLLPNKQQFASCSGDKTIKIWSL
jgi:WD40 repeat protein